MYHGEFAKAFVLLKLINLGIVFVLSIILVFDLVTPENLMLLITFINLKTHLMQMLTFAYLVSYI